MSKNNYDFAGWATRNDILCSDGRVIKRDAFNDNDGQVVPIFWNHQHDEISNVLGHALLENRPEGVYAYGTFNDTQSGKHAKVAVEHGDVKGLSIYANKLMQNGPNVLHGMIREVSLVTAGANSGAYIESVIRHGEKCEDAAVIFTGGELELSHSDDEKEKPMPKNPPVEDDDEDETTKSAGKEKTVGDVFNTLNEEQKTVVYALIGQALKNKGKSADDDEDDDEETEQMKHNVFSDEYDNEENTLSHAEMLEISEDAKRLGSMKEAFLQHGINQIDMLFPDYKNVGPNEPIFVQRNMDWVTSVMNGVKHSGFARVKSMFADITGDEARARGYIKGDRKEEEVFALLKRTTEPKTIYKMQGFDRDDIIDITDLDVIAWVKKEMRMMLDEEIARAILVSDGRSTLSKDKINEENIRSIYKDDDFFSIKYPIVIAANTSNAAKAKAFIRATIKSRKEYRGSGNPVMFMTEDMLTECLLLEDLNQRIIYDTEEKLRTALRVSKIVTVPVMEGLTRNQNGKTMELAGIYVNLNDYNVGADKGGSVNLFDDFDIHFNKYEYLIETRCSGALVKPFSAVVLEFCEGDPITLGIAPENKDNTVLGKKVSELQSHVTVFQDQIAGQLNYVTGYEGYSETESEQSGNFLALKFAASPNTTTTVQISGKAAKTLEDDMTCVLRVTSNSQTVTVVSTDGDQTVTKTLYLNGLNLRKA